MITTARPYTVPAVGHIDDGRPVVWAGWVYAACTRQRAQCTQCRYRGPHWVAYGQVQPTPGEQWTTATDGVRGPARPTLCLVAYQCPGCDHRRVIDLAGGGWNDITPEPSVAEQLTLFGDIPQQRKKGSTR